MFSLFIIYRKFNPSFQNCEEEAERKVLLRPEEDWQDK